MTTGFKLPNKNSDIRIIVLYIGGSSKLPLK